MARCGCGTASGCGCALQAGTNTTVTGSGTQSNPWVVNAVTNCAQVRGCLSAGCGVTYDSATGVIASRVSTDVNNALECRANGLFVSAGAATVTAGCGLTGNGSPADPLTVNGGTWPYACDIAANGSVIVCDPATGQLYGEPPTQTVFFQETTNTVYPDLAVPASSGAPTFVAKTETLTFDNPSTCKTARTYVFLEADVDFDLPPGGEAAYTINGDEMWRDRNTGSSTQAARHTQTSRMFSTNILPGGTFTFTEEVRIGRGAGGATYSRIQTAVRAYVVI